MQSSRKPKIVIVGAGPAGTGAAIGLAGKGFQTVLIEREKFPRHKLCGEFISPECLRRFKKLGAAEEILKAGGAEISETFFFTPNGKNLNIKSKWFEGRENALGLSRAEMDLRLLNCAEKAGVEVFEKTSVSGLLFENDKVCGVRLKDGKEISADLTVDATGRARVLGRFAEKIKNRNLPNPTKNVKPQFVGFKTHLKNAALEHGRCEIYFFRGGYGGLNYIENETANHCFLVKSEIVKEFGGSGDAILREVIFKNRRAAETLSSAAALYDWLTVSITDFGKRDLNPADGLLTIGDAGAFIDPFTGSGMLMALESAELLTESADFGNFSSSETRAKYLRLHSEVFDKRLGIGKFLRRAAFNPQAAGFLISALSIGQMPRKFLARATRSGF